ncbi:MAG: HAD hydrolase family protein [Lachnospiraceae bacterium]|nr:HAD hydrolase family protein [Lachnospiraceae bacterium]
MGKKLVIFDVDGTIISGEHVVPESAKEAIRAIRANGNHVVYYTGRPCTHVEESVREIGFDGCICTMGAYLEIGGEVLQDERPEPGIAHGIVEAVRSCHLDAAFESRIGIQFDQTRPLPKFLQGLKAHFSSRGFETDLDIDAADFSFEKVCVWTNEESDLARFEEIATKDLDIIGKKQNMEELVAKGVSIPDCLKKVQEHFGVSFENSYAIGDSINDLPMLRCTAHSMAMGEASDEMKSQVEFVTKGIMEDGLAYAMKHYGLI